MSKKQEQKHPGEKTRAMALKWGQKSPATGIQSDQSQGLWGRRTAKESRSHQGQAGRRERKLQQTGVKYLERNFLEERMGRLLR